MLFPVDSLKFIFYNYFFFKSYFYYGDQT